MSNEIVQIINSRIEEIQSDEQMQYDDANVQTNAPLALHQCKQKGRLQELRWMKEVLQDD
jgi:hypothetical protein